MVRRISSNISGCRPTEPIFAIFSPYESVYMTMMDLFWICTLFSNFSRDVAMATDNVAVMKANRYYVHSLHVRQMEHGFILLGLATNATISCKILVKIGLVVFENSLTNGPCVAR